MRISTTRVVSEELGRLRAIWPLLAALLLASAPGAAAPEADMLPAEAQAGSLLLKMRSGYRVATRINTDVSIAVSGLTVRTELRQAFRNDGDAWVEGVYVFPLPEGAAVDRMRLVVGDRVIEGEIQEKRQARARYEAARRQGKRTSLVDQQRPNLFTTSVANIAPGETVVIEIGYLDTARYDEGTFSLRVPMTFTPRYIPGHATGDRQGSGWSPDTDRVPDASLITPPVVAGGGDHRLTLNASIDAGMPLAHIASRYHPVDVVETPAGYRLTLDGRDVVTDHDVELEWRPPASAAPRAMLFSERVGERPHMLVMVVPPSEDATSIEAPPRDLVFVVDTSGSMHGVSIEQARQSLLRALDGLRPVDHFNVIQFNNSSTSLFPASVAATAANLRRAREYVSGLSANGGTEMRAALELALGGSKHAELFRQVIFITDGSVGNEAELFGVIEDLLGDSRLFTVGIGSAPNGWFMRKAAEAGRGSFVTVSAQHEVEEKMARLVRKLERPMLTDIRIDWPTGVGEVAYPAEIPDLYAGEPILIKARLERSPLPGEQLAISGNLAGAGWGAALALRDAGSGPGAAAVWARAHIADLLDRERRGENPEAVRADLVETALAHRIVSKYTSLVAVDKTPVRSAGAGLVREQVPNLLPHGQSMNAIFGFPATATAAPVYRRNGALLLGLASLLLLFKVWTLRGRGRHDD